MQKPRNRLVIFAFVTAVILSCGIPTSMPILPKEVVVKANPSVSLPLGRVNYNLYSGITGGNMARGLGSLDNLLGASWLQDLADQGATVYDYRPAGSEDDDTQKFLIHYKLDMEDTLGSSGELDMSEYREMLNDLTGGTSPVIEDKSFKVPSVNMTETFNVNINMNQVTGEIFTKIESIESYTAYLPVDNDVPLESFPQDILDLNLTGNPPDFSVTLDGLDSLTLKNGQLDFSFTLLNLTDDDHPFLPPPPGSKLELSGFELRPKGGNNPVLNVTATPNTVTLEPGGTTEKIEMRFDDAELPGTFDLVCKLNIIGAGPGFFKLEIAPAFEDFTISGVNGLVLTEEQIQSLEYTFPEEPHRLEEELGDSFHATVATGELIIDARQLFPSMDDTEDHEEGWNLAMNLSAVFIEQDPVFDGITQNNITGLSLGRPPKPSLVPFPEKNSLKTQNLNSQPVMIRGKVTMQIPEEDKLPDNKGKLSFRNFPNPDPDGDPNDGGIKKGADNISYNTKLFVNMNVFLFSEVTALAGDVGLEETDAVHEIKPDLGGDFASFKDWLNYAKFKKGGLGAILTIGALNNAGGMDLYVDAEAFGLDNAYRPLVKPSGQQGAEVNCTNDADYTLEELPDELLIKIKLGREVEVPGANTKQILMTIRDVVPGTFIELNDMTANMIFDWAEMSVKPKRHENNKDEDDPLPTYPFEGTYPDQVEGEEGIDLSDFPKGLAFYIPDPEGDEAGEGMSASLYISLKRQKFENDAWVDDPDGPDEGWGDNLRVNLPSLDFRVKYGEGAGDTSDNLFSYDSTVVKDTGQWALARPLNLEAPEFADLVKRDAENKDNPFKIYSSPTLPEPDKAIPMGNLAKVFNENLIGGKDLYFTYTVELASVPKDDGSSEPGEIILYPAMLEKRIAASVDLLIVVPLIFTAIQTDPDPDPDNPAPMTIIIDPDLGNEDLFGRKNADDSHEYFDMVTSLEFDVNIKNLAGLNKGRFFLESPNDSELGYYRTSVPIVDFSQPKNKFSLSGEELEELKTICPFIPRVAIEFDPGEKVKITRNFNIELQSITVKAGGEYTFETGW